MTTPISNSIFNQTVTSFDAYAFHTSVERRDINIYFKIHE